MSSDTRHALIVGGDSRIGRAIAERLLLDGWRVTSTTRRGASGTNVIELPLERVVSDGPPPLDGYDAMIIAAAVTGHAACESAPERARVVNVEAPEILTKAGIAAGTKIVLLSTNLVLGGDSAFLDVTAPWEPVGEYGHQKADAEAAILSLHGALEHVAILRLTKVLDSRLPLLEMWRQQASRGEMVNAFRDLVMAPVSLMHAATALQSLLEAEATGIFHCSGGEEISYAVFAKIYFQHLGLDPLFVNAIEGRRTNPTAAAAPLHASLAHADDDGTEPYIRQQPLAELLDELVG